VLEHRRAAIAANVRQWRRCLVLEEHCHVDEIAAKVNWLRPDMLIQIECGLAYSGIPARSINQAQEELRK
jgi:hypothetical protein